MPPFEKCYCRFLSHLDKLDASFCWLLCHPPLLTTSCFICTSVKTGISIQLVAIANLNVTPTTFLDFSATTQNEIGFPIRVGRFIFYLVCLMKG